jgi:hypothetical protein
VVDESVLVVGAYAEMRMPVASGMSPPPCSPCRRRCCPPEEEDERAPRRGAGEGAKRATRALTPSTPSLTPAKLARALARTRARALLDPMARVRLLRKFERPIGFGERKKE